MRHGAARLEEAQRAAGVPAALELLDEAGRALLLLAYRHGMPDSEIAVRVGADVGMVATLREGWLERLVTVTGASSREAVIAWLAFVPEASLVPADGPGTALAPVSRESSGDVWREAKLLSAVVAAVLVLYAAAEFDPGSRPAAVPADRPPAATAVAVAPGHPARRAGPRTGSGRASRHAGRRPSARPPASGAPAVVRAPSSPSAPVRIAAAPAPRAVAPRGRRGVAGVTTTRPAPHPQPQPPSPGPAPVRDGNDGGSVVARPTEPAEPRPARHSGGAPGRHGGGPPGLRGGGPPGLRGGGPPGLRGGGPPGHNR
jgi:hypothetical protein